MLRMIHGTRRASGQMLIVLLGLVSTLGPFSNDSVLPIFVYTVGLGISMPCITVLVLDLMPERRGLAFSVVGFAQSGFSAVLAGVVSHQVDETALTLALCSLVMVAFGLACWLGYLTRLALRLRGVEA